jgi:hypothetical protein
MAEPIKVFKTSIVGGFDRRDVIEYVKAISAQRNSAQRELAAAREELSAAQAKLELAQTECVAANEDALSVRSIADEEILKIRAEADERIAAAIAETEALRREFQEYKVLALDEAAEKLRELDAKFDEVRGSIKTLCASIDGGNPADGGAPAPAAQPIKPAEAVTEPITLDEAVNLDEIVDQADVLNA